MKLRPFKGSFTQQEPISEEGVAAAVEVLRSGRLHRYNTVGDELSEAALLEQEFARYQGSRYALACASGGYALHVALRAAGLRHGEPVLTNAFTLAPVPGAIVNAGGRPVFFEITRDLVPDLDDLERKAASSGARFLMLSYMRGHMPDMDELMALVARLGLTLIEDCAHTMGASWNGRKSGSFGLAGCFSTQTYKHLNSGEGGLLTSDDAELMARAILMSGSYMLYERHGAAPDPAVFSDIRLDTPNFSGRMDNLRAAILRTQLASLDDNVARWNERYRTVEARLRPVEGHLSAQPAVAGALCRQFDPVHVSRPVAGGGERLCGSLRIHGCRDKMVRRRRTDGLHEHPPQLALSPAPGLAVDGCHALRAVRHAAAPDFLDRRLPAYRRDHCRGCRRSLSEGRRRCLAARPSAA